MGKNNEKSSFIRDLLMGFCLGTANIIPGVSGGTFLLIFKIYERVFAILNNINKVNALEGFAHVTTLLFKTGRIGSAKAFKTFLEKNDFIFLFKLILGSVAAILSLSSLMKYLIGHHFSVTYALFFGLILVSIIIPVKMLKQKKLHLIVFVVLGAVATIYVTMAVNPYEKATLKSATYEAQYLKDREGHPQQQAGAFSFTGKYTRDEYLYASLCGAVAISAMILPGISGSLVLILMGEYFEVVSAISGLRTLGLDHFFFLGCFALGMVLGGLVFARLVNAVLKRFYNATMAFLIGLMAGSLYALWPFKKSMILAEQYIKKDGVIHMVQNVNVYTNMNEIPQMGTVLYLSGVSFIIGCVIMSFFIEKESKP